MMTEPEIQPGWFLSADELADTRIKVDKINARAVRRGFTGRLLLESVPEVVSRTPAPGAPEVRVHGFRVRVTGDAPRYEGWVFLAGVDVVPGSDQVVLRFAPGVDTETVNRAGLDGVRCDHCHTVRGRRHAYLVRHAETGETLQVGATCIKDFLGWSTMPAFLSEDDVVDELERTLTPSGGAAWDVLNVLAYAWASVQEHGWSASSSKHPTRYQVEDLLTGRAKRPEFDAIQPRMAEAEQLAPTIHRALLEAFADATEGYQANLRAVLSGEAVTSRHLGLAVSAIPAYDRLLGQQAVSATREERPASAWLGSTGEKVTITGVVITALTVDGYAYNTTQMLVVIDAAPTIAKIYTSAAWADEISVGDQVTITGTVKAHETWRDEIHQTVLTRTKRLIPAVDQECSTAARG